MVQMQVDGPNFIFLDADSPAYCHYFLLLILLCVCVDCLIIYFTNLKKKPPLFGGKNIIYTEYVS